MTQNRVQLALVYPDFKEEKQTKFLYFHEKSAGGKFVTNQRQNWGVKYKRQAGLVFSMYTLGNSFINKVPQT